MLNTNGKPGEQNPRCKKTVWGAGLQCKAEARGFCTLAMEREGCPCCPSLTGRVPAAVSSPAQTPVPVRHPSSHGINSKALPSGAGSTARPALPAATSRGRAGPGGAAGAGPAASCACAVGARSRRAVSGARGARGAGARPGALVRARREGGGAPGRGVPSWTPHGPLHRPVTADPAAPRGRAAVGPAGVTPCPPEGSVAAGGPRSDARGRTFSGAVRVPSAARREERRSRAGLRPLRAYRKGWECGWHTSYFPSAQSSHQVC